MQRRRATRASRPARHCGERRRAVRPQPAHPDRSTPARARSASRRSGCSSAPHYDLHRLGFFFTPAPRHADLLLVTGPTVRAFDVAAAQDLRGDARARRWWSRPGRARSAASTSRTRSCTVRSTRCCRSTCGFPAARPARWRCCRGCCVAVGRLAEKMPGLTFIAEIGRRRRMTRAGPRCAARPRRLARRRAGRAAGRGAPAAGLSACCALSALGGAARALAGGGWSLVYGNTPRGRPRRRPTIVGRRRCSCR